MSENRKSRPSIKERMNRLVTPRKQNRKQRLKTIFTPRNMIIMVLFVFVASGFIRDSRGLTIYQKIRLGQSAVQKYPNINKEVNSTMRILIDPGHGGRDIGTTSVLGETEKELTLKVSERLEKQLRDAGFQVEMTRTEDVEFADTVSADLAAREKLIQGSGADLVVSVHMNWIDDPEISGPIVFYRPGSAQGERFAGAVQSQMNTKLNPSTQRGPRAQNFYVLRSGSMPSILVECGFVSNQAEAKSLRTPAYQEKVAESIAWGIMDYLTTQE